MEDLLNKLFENLGSVFNNSLKKNEIIYLDKSSEIDVLSTLIRLKKNANDIYKLMVEGSIPINELDYFFDKSLVRQAIEEKYIIRGNTISKDKVFIGANGMFTLYTLKGLNIKDVFISFDSNKFTSNENIILKSQEKILSIFLILLGADCKNNLLDTRSASLEKLEKYHAFFKIIEDEMIQNDISLGKKIGWTTGKDVTFRKFITNNVLLPKTNIFYSSDNKYYLDLTKRKTAKYLLDLLLHNYTGEERLTANDIFYNTLMDLSFKISNNLEEVPPDINKYILEELRG